MATTRRSAATHSSANGMPASFGDFGATSDSDENVKWPKCFLRSRIAIATRATTTSASSNSHGDAKRIMRRASVPHPPPRRNLPTSPKGKLLQVAMPQDLRDDVILLPLEHFRRRQLPPRPARRREVIAQRVGELRPPHHVIVAQRQHRRAEPLRRRNLGHDYGRLLSPPQQRGNDHRDQRDDDGDRDHHAHRKRLTPRRDQRRRRHRVLRLQHRAHRHDEVLERHVPHPPADGERLCLERAHDRVRAVLRDDLVARRPVERDRRRKVDGDRIADGRRGGMDRGGRHLRSLRSRKKRKRSRSYGTAVETSIQSTPLARKRFSSCCARAAARRPTSALPRSTSRARPSSASTTRASAPAGKRSSRGSLTTTATTSWRSLILLSGASNATSRKSEITRTTARLRATRSSTVTA